MWRRKVFIVLETSESERRYSSPRWRLALWFAVTVILGVWFMQSPVQAGSLFVGVDNKNLDSDSKYYMGPVKNEKNFSSILEDLSSLCPCLNFSLKNFDHTKKIQTQLNKLKKDAKKTKQPADRIEIVSTPKKGKAFCECYQKYRIGCNLIQKLVSASEPTVIFQAKRRLGVDFHGNVAYTPRSSRSKVSKMDWDGKPAPPQYKRPSFVGLAHELAHRYHDFSTKNQRIERFHDLEEKESGAKNKIVESWAVRIENQIRWEHHVLVKKELDAENEKLKDKALTKRQKTKVKNNIRKLTLELKKLRPRTHYGPTGKLDALVQPLASAKDRKSGIAVSEKNLFPKICKKDKYVYDCPTDQLLKDRKVSFNPEPQDPEGEYIAQSRPISFQLVTREPEVCVGTKVTMTLGEGFEELVVGRLLELDVIEGLVTTINEEENPAPELLETPVEIPATPTQPEEVETPGELTLAVPEEEQSEPVPSSEEQPEIPQTEEQTPPAEEVDLGLVKANLNVLLNPAEAQSGTVIKLTSDIPPLPGAVELAEIDDAELADLELIEVVGLDGEPVANLDDQFRSDAFYQSDQKGLIVTDNEQPALEGNPQLSNLIDEAVIQEIGKRIRSGELEADPVKDRKAKSIKKKLERDFEEYGRVGLDYRLYKWGPKIKPPPLTLDTPTDEMGERDKDPIELGDGEEILLAAPANDTHQVTAQLQRVDADGEASFIIDLRDSSREKTKPLIVALKPSQSGRLTNSQLREAGQQLAAEMLVGNPARAFSIGAIPVFVFNLIETQFEEKRRQLLTSTSVSFIEEDPCRVKENDDPHYVGSGLWGQSFDNQWAIKRVGFETKNHSALAPSEGENAIIVAVIDSGIDWFHPDLPQSALWRNSAEILGNGVDDDGNGYVDDTIGWDFIDNNNKPWDQDGHGTFVAGVIAAGQDNGIGIRGISSAVKIMPLKALDAFGQGHASMVSEAIIYAVDNGAKIINLSLGGRQPTNLERLAIEYATASQVLVVAASGNQGAPVADFAPASLPGVLTVAATDRRDKRAGFSNWGPAIDIAAPGVDVLSLRARDTDLLSLIEGVTYQAGTGIVGEDRAYFRASGTSFAAPIVSGAAVTLLAKNPDLSALELKRILTNSASDIEANGFDNLTGYGLLDIRKAIDADPNYFVESRVGSVRAVTVQGKQALQIRGTANANEFAGATLYLGQGRVPKKWFRVKSRIEQPVSNGQLIVLPARVFARAPRWTLRLDVEHRDGSSRSSQFDLRLQ